MNIVIVYYSYSGNTDQATQIIEAVLKPHNSVKRLKINAPKESNNFFIQALRGLTKRKVEIDPIEADLSPYDLIMFGTPVWAREMVPAMRQFLEQATGLEGKKAVAFVTYGSGLGKGHCLDSLEQALQKKGASQVSCFALSQFKVSDKSLIESLLKKTIASKPKA